MKPYIVYDGTGLILQTGQCPESMFELQASPGRNLMSGSADQMTEYILAGAVTPRPTMPIALSAESVAADGTSEVTIDGIPAGATVSVAGPTKMTGEADGGPIVMTFAIQGDYTVSADLFPYQTAKVSIHAI